ncbi:MAG TPA: serine hydrolase domain-containing protein [Actinomycetota bacterium]|nr:serine hydrolase domain-containing protein [Actinomycetota bacterium]
MATRVLPTREPPQASPLELDLRTRVAQVLDRWPSAGLAVAVVRDGSPEWFLGPGVADVRSREPITEATVFRVGSLTKTFTAIAVMQLWEQGLVDLDAPASEFLRTFRLVPAKASFRPATVRHLLTHTAGVGYWRRLSDLLRPGVGSGDRAGRSGAPPLADYYRKGLPVEIEPGTKWVYSNHGFAALGQIVEDVTGGPLDRYLRERVFDPLGMEHTDLVRSERVREQLATGYVLRSRGLKPVADREILTPGGSGMFSTTADMARYLAALLHGGVGEHGSVLEPETLASMFEPHFQLDPRTAGMGLGLEPNEESGHRTVWKTGVVSGFLSAMVVAPDDGLGIVVLSNTGGLDGRGAAEPLAAALLRRLLGLPDQAIRTDIPPRPETWSEICGWYSPDPGPVTNLFMRALWGAGAEVVVRGGHLLLKPLTPVPALRRGMRLYPDDPDDPWVFRVEIPEYGKHYRVVFTRSEGGEMRLLMEVLSFRKRPDARNPRRLLRAGVAVGAASVAARRVRSRASRVCRQ